MRAQQMNIAPEQQRLAKHSNAVHSIPFPGERAKAISQPPPWRLNHFDEPVNNEPGTNPQNAEYPR